MFMYRPSKTGRVNLVARLTSRPSQRSGTYDLFSYGYLGFTFVDNVVYYLTGAPIILPNGDRVKGKDTKKGEAKGLEYLHLITYNLETDHYHDHGAIFFEDGSFPTYVNSIAVLDNFVYAMGRRSRFDSDQGDSGERSDIFRVKFDMSLV